MTVSLGNTPSGNGTFILRVHVGFPPGAEGLGLVPADALGIAIRPIFAANGIKVSAPSAPGLIEHRTARIGRDVL